MYGALLDTGAQTTMISPRVVEEEGLEAIGLGSIVPVSGKPITTQKYRIPLSIPVGRGTEVFVSGMELEVLLLPFQPDNFDILLGMDLLAAFHFTMYGGNLILSN